MAKLVQIVAIEQCIVYTNKHNGNYWQERYWIKFEILFCLKENIMNTLNRVYKPSFEV